jgi:hypothetical protein
VENIRQLGRVSERYALDREVASYRTGERDRVGRIRNGGLCVEKLEDTTRGADRFLVAPKKGCERADRRRHTHRQQEELHKGPGGELLPQRHVPPLPEHRHDGAEAEERQHAEEQGAYSSAPNRAGHDIAHVVPISPRLLRLPYEALHGANV